MDEQEMLEAEEMDEVTEVEGEVGQDEEEFTDTGANEDEAADHPTEEADATEVEVDKSIEGKKSATQAEKRRAREAKEAEVRKRIEQESYRKGIVDAIGGVNPYTNEEIKDEADIDEYLLMKKLDKAGKDPINDYPSAVKGERREKAEKEKAEKNHREELEAFAEKYPDVKISELLQDERFGKFAGKRVQHESLADVYADYLEFTAVKEAEVERKAVVKAKEIEIKKKASPGSLTGSGDVPKLSYADMSDEEFEKAYNEVMRGTRKI